jgi:hypothetical protein
MVQDVSEVLQPMLYKFFVTLIEYLTILIGHCVGLETA